MRVCIVGGIFDKPSSYRVKHAATPETILAEGLRSRGLEVSVAGHASFRPGRGYDVVHVHHLGMAAIRMALSKGKSAFVFTGHDGPMLCRYERSLVRRLAFRYVVNSADAIVGLTSIEQEYLRSLVRDRVPVYRIPNGIPPHLYEGCGDRLRRAEPGYRLLYVGQLIELKGVGVLLRAMQLIQNTQEGRNATLLLVYQNPEGETRYRELAERLGITASVRFVGFLSTRALAALYQRVDLVVLPSFAESLPSVLTEAMLCGKPVVATRVGGIPEQVGQFGTLVEPGDHIQLAEALVAALREMPRLRALAPQLRRYAVGNFGVEGMVSSHLRLYSDLARTAQAREARAESLAGRILAPGIGAWRCVTSCWRR